MSQVPDVLHILIYYFQIIWYWFLYLTVHWECSSVSKIYSVKRTSHSNHSIFSCDRYSLSESKGQDYNMLCCGFFFCCCCFKNPLRGINKDVIFLIASPLVPIYCKLHWLLRRRPLSLHYYRDNIYPR